MTLNPFRLCFRLKRRRTILFHVERRDFGEDQLAQCTPQDIDGTSCVVTVVNSDLENNVDRDRFEVSVRRSSTCPRVRLAHDE